MPRAWSKIRHKDIKPNKILYQWSQDVARFLWADFGLAHDFEKSVVSRTINPSSRSARYAAAENAESDQAFMDTKAAGFDDTNKTQDTDDEYEPLQLSPGPCKRMRKGSNLPAHGRSTDISSHGCVFIETLSALANPKIPQSDTRGFAFRKHIGILQDQAQLCVLADPSRVPFSLTAKMIECKAKRRPKVEEVASVLIDSTTPERIFCAACLPIAKGASAASLAAHEAQQTSNGGRISEDSASVA